MSEPPVRLCCFQRHHGPQCPDGLVMCGDCFERFPVDQLDVDPTDGRPLDVCRPCAGRSCSRCDATTEGANNVCADCAAEMGLDRL